MHVIKSTILGTAVLLGSFLSPALLADEIKDCGNEKTAICHIPPGNPENAQLIVIASAAVETHRDHHSDIFLGCGKTKDFADVDCSALAGLESGTGGSTVLGMTFTLCDNRTGETGRAVSILPIGRASATRMNCE